MSYKDEVQLIQQPDLSEPEVPPKDKKFKGYYKISRHYNWALNTTFKYGYDFVIIVEGEWNIQEAMPAQLFSTSRWSRRGARLLRIFPRIFPAAACW